MSTANEQPSPEPSAGTPSLEPPAVPAPLVPPAEPPSPELADKPSLLEVNDLGEFVNDLLSRFTSGELIWYRGHARSGWKLTPSLSRKGGMALERSLTNEFKRDAYPHLARAQLAGADLSEWDWMFLMQHYGVPTRLMDWSESPLVGMFFALDETGVDEKPGPAAVWVLRPQALNDLSLTPASQPWDVPMCGESEDLDAYTLSRLDIGSRKLIPLAAVATRRFDRIIAQKGTFTVIHKDERPIEDIAFPALFQYVIPSEAKPKIRQQLEVFGVTAASIYPDLEHLGRRIGSRLS